MAHFVNDPDLMVTEAIDGLVAANAELTRLDGFPDIKVVLRADWVGDRVALISGGGAGHEPAHTGFVGLGLLTAAVSGEIFASPSVEAVLAAILAVTGEAGALLIVKNYTGDRLNFGLAMERARALGKNVEMVVVGDDVALPESVQARGLAGTLLVHKAAGAAAERGDHLARVRAIAQEVANSLRTIGVSLSHNDIPGREQSLRFEAGQAELGLGIHGEPGAQRIDADEVGAIVRRIAADLTERLPGDGPVVVLVNNLGSMSAIELGVVVRDLLDTDLGRRCAGLLGPDALMTSMGMHGFSLTAVAASDVLLESLAAPVAAHTAWPPLRTPTSTAPEALPAMDRGEAIAPSDNPAVRSLLSAVCAAVLDAEDELNSLDAQVGDGDTGTTFATAARRIEDALDDLALDDGPSLMSQLSRLLAVSMGGSSGVLGSIFFEAAGVSMRDGAQLPAALQAGLDTMSRIGGAQIGDRTMIDALAPALFALARGASLDDAAAAGESGARSTASMTSAKAGRSSYVGSDHLRDVVDPGAEAVAIVVRAIADLA